MSDIKRNRAGRNRSRRLLMQALYQGLLNDQPLPEVRRQFQQDGQLDDADQEFFLDLIAEVDKSRIEFDELIGRLADRPIVQIDPVEHAVLLGALAEFSVRVDVPYRVVISEAVILTKRFGGAESHRYVNAILDRAARELRPDESGGTAK